MPRLRVVGEDKPFIEELLDRVFFAPIGAAVELKNNFSGVTAQGRDRVESTVRVVGEFARTLIDSVVDRFDQLTDQVNSSVISGTDPSSSPSHFEIGSPLPIENYESLSAETIIARLGQLNASERGAIAEFELSHRGRRTIIGRLRQLEEE